MSRVLIVNADDLGIHAGAVESVIETMDRGITTSASLMVPAHGAERALRLLAQRPDLAVGVHLTLVADFPDRPWRPLTDGRSLLDPSGRLYSPGAEGALLAQARIDEVAAEFRAQIEEVLSAGVTPTHLDWHCLADGGREDVFDVTLGLALEYGVAVRAWLDRSRDELRRRGLPSQDHPFLDSFAIPPADKPEVLLQRLRDLPEGVTEWAMHPAATDPGTADGGVDVRRTDYDFLLADRTAEVIAEEAVTVIGYGEILHDWRG